MRYFCVLVSGADRQVQDFRKPFYSSTLWVKGCPIICRVSQTVHVYYNGAKLYSAAQEPLELAVLHRHSAAAPYDNQFNAGASGDVVESVTIDKPGSVVGGSNNEASRYSTFGFFRDFENFDKGAIKYIKPFKSQILTSICAFRYSEDGPLSFKLNFSDGWGCVDIEQKISASTD
ncbi:hypothetical protein RRG08_062529 [Elysia crispata]|uniref:Uncharacterized protein n=1 Tax=Elysia crispata TaxID=231223 RepID=A0AAE1ATR5_9GAST|nr:hypothetical protein RRG08_062529 [Elysia crispata]